MTRKIAGLLLLSAMMASTVTAQEAEEPPKRIEFEEFLVIAGEDIAREFASCAGYYAVWAATLENTDNAQTVEQLREITQFALDTATEAARGVRSGDAVNEFVRGYVVDTATNIQRILEEPGAEWATIYSVYDDACRWALDNQDEAVEQWTARTAARLQEQGYELAEPPPEVTNENR